MSTISRIGVLTSRLRADIAGEVIAPDDAGYDRARAVFFPMFDRRPAAIVRPVDADEVACVVSHAREGGYELAIRSGGHSAAGHGASDGGIVLDLSLMKTIDIDADRRVAWAQTGLTAGEVTAAAHAHGLAIGLGDTASVGIGGLTLSGGIGFLVRKHGLTIDDVLAADVVTADGRLVRTDAEHDPDLYWAIRGGGGNFGVVIRFRYRLHPVDEATGGMLVLPALPETIAAFVAATEAAPDDLSTSATITLAPPMPFIPRARHGTPVIIATLLHAGPRDAGQRALAPFRDLAPPIANMLRPLAYPDIYPAEEHTPHPPIAIRTTFLETVDRGVAVELLDRLQTSPAQMPIAQIRVLGGAMARVPADATAFAHRSSRIMLNLVARYENPHEAAAHAAWATDAAAALGDADAGAYVGFLSDEGEPRVRAAYPGRTWERLVAVKRRYDPANLFRVNHNIAPAVDDGTAHLRR